MVVLTFIVFFSTETVSRQDRQAHDWCLRKITHPTSCLPVFSEVIWLEKKIEKSRSLNKQIKSNNLKIDPVLSGKS